MIHAPEEIDVTSTTPLAEDIALRIGLAARVLPDTDPARLLGVLAEIVGLPPSAERLARLKVRDLRQASNGELGDLDTETLKSALAILHGELPVLSEPAPAIEAYRDGEMPDSIRVACASDSGELLDGHFGSANRFLIYQVSASEVRLIAVRDVTPPGPDEDRNGARATLIADCQLLYVASIGGPAAARVVKHDILPIKDPSGGSARERMEVLSGILASEQTPPWLAKVMGHAPEQRVRFQLDECAA